MYGRAGPWRASDCALELRHSSTNAALFANSVSSALCDAGPSGRILAGASSSAAVHSAPDIKLWFATHGDSVSMGVQLGELKAMMKLSVCLSISRHEDLQRTSLTSALDGAQWLISRIGLLWNKLCQLISQRSLISVCHVVFITMNNKLGTV